MDDHSDINSPNCDNKLIKKKRRRRRRHNSTEKNSSFKDSFKKLPSEFDNLEANLRNLLIKNSPVASSSSNNVFADNVSNHCSSSSSEIQCKVYYTITDNGIKLTSIPKNNLKDDKKKLDVKNSKKSLRKTNDKNVKIELNNEQQSSGTPKKRRAKNRNIDDSQNSEGTDYMDYWSEDSVKLGLKNGDLIESCIRINPRNFKEAYITNPCKSEQDILIESLRDRNRSLEGDIVVVQLKKPEDWRPNNQKTGVVVFILKQVHHRTAVGNLKLMRDKNHTMAAFSPRDSRMPRIRIPYTDWPSSFYHDSKKYEDTLFLAKIVSWDDTRFAVGTIIETIGHANDLKTETKAILLDNGLDVTPYSSEMNNYFPDTNEIPIEEFKYREDLRTECIFTIDPLTARDLDDAVSCKQLSNGNLEIGVHISDVSYFLKENTPLDKIVSEKATTIYLVESVYHMLPRDLCMLCSLLPGEDKLAFSVFWEIKNDGEIVNYRFARTIINSCCQLAYEHAQILLDKPKHEIDFSKFPNISGNHTYDDIKRTVLQLHKIALILRNNRFENGALRINQPKLCFQLDPITGLPDSYSIYLNEESHRLIEEFMLLANITVATKLHSEFPDIAFLRNHPPPHNHLMENLKRNFEKVGIHLDTSTAGTLHRSMEKYGGDDLLSQARMTVINAICAKPMARATYFCSGMKTNTSQYWHYALNVPLYTHFTSPIRRYADVLVHRLLATYLGYTKTLDWETQYVSELAANCNRQKYNAKRAGEQSAELYLAKYLELKQPVEEYAVVLDVKDKSFDVIIMNMGINSRIYINNISASVLDKKKENSFTLQWPVLNDTSQPIEQTIEMFSLIRVQLTVTKGLKIESKLLPPL